MGKRWGILCGRTYVDDGGGAEGDESKSEDGVEIHGSKKYVRC